MAFSWLDLLQYFFSMLANGKRSVLTDATNICIYIYIQNMYANSDVLSIFSGSTSQKSIDSMLSGNARRDARYP